MSVNLSPVGGAGAQFCDNNGNPLNGGKLYTYSAGTTTPAATYTSAAGSVFHPNPIVLNAGGRVPDSGEIWLSDNISYKFVLKTSADVLIATWDNINGINSNFVNYTIQEEVITATAGQTVFNLSTITYAPGTNSLAVYIDGVNQIVTDSYVETDANTVTFVSGLHDGALVKFTTAVPATGTATNADVVAYDPPFTGGVSTTVEAKLAQTVSVKDFGAVGDGVTDDTAAFNLATEAASTFTGFADALYREIYVPAGQYNIAGRVYLHKGQHLRGAGMGATYLYMGATGNIKMGESSGGAPDPTGLAPEVSDMIIVGGSPAINCSVAGANIRSIMFSAPVTGVSFSGSDLVIDNCIFDDGSSHILSTGFNLSVTNCIFYLGNQQIYFGGSAADTQVSGCVFEYAEVASIYLSGGNNKNINVDSSTFFLNQQHSTHQAFIYSASSTSDSIYVSGCSFRNGKGPIYKHTSGSTYASFKACVIDGNKTRSAYVQSTTAYGIEAGGVLSIDVTDCTFKNLLGTVFNITTAGNVNIKNCDVSNSTLGVVSMPANGGKLVMNDVDINTTGDTPITFTGTSSQSMKLDGVRFTSTGGTYDITIAGASANASVELYNIIGSGRQLFSYTGTTLFSANNLKNWLNPVVASTSRYVEVPFVGAQTFQFSVTANPNSGGSNLYRKSTYGVFDVNYDLSGSINTNVAKTTLHSSGTGTYAAPAVTAEMSTLGGGATASGMLASGVVVLSWPTTYNQETLAITPINGVRPV